MKTLKRKNRKSFSTLSTGCLSIALLVPIGELDGCCDDGCLINDCWYDDGESNPENACELCDVASSTTKWTSLPAGSSCEYCLECSTSGTCTEVSGNCCSTADFADGTCEETPEILVEEGCIFSHDWWGVHNELTSGIYIDRICAEGGEFELYGITHTTIQYCPGCPNEIFEKWTTESCAFEFETETYTCSGD